MDSHARTIRVSSPLDLPLEEQRRLAKKDGFATLEAWQQHEAEVREIVQKDLDMCLNPPPPNRAEADELIHDLRTKPGYIDFYRRMSGNDDLTVEELIASIEADFK